MESARVDRRKPHSTSLDLTRASAEVLVFTCHLPMYGVVALGAGWSHLMGGFKVGVLIFFVLSGLLLYRPFLRGSVDVPTYLRRRAARILPAYVVAIAGTWLLLGPPPDILPYLFFAQNYEPELFNGWLGVTWTLQLEVIFYLLLPALALILRRRQWLLIPITAGSYLGAAAVFGSPIAQSRLAGSLFPFAFWAFGLGMGLAVLEQRGALLPFGRPASLLLGLGMLGASVAVGLAWQTIDIFGGTAAFLIVGFAATRTSVPVPARFAAWAAAISYSAYLWHTTIMTTVREWPFAPLAAIVLTLLVASAVYALVEAPAMRWAVGGPLISRRAGRASGQVPARPVPEATPGGA